MRILLVDDHAVVRSGMKQMLADNFGEVEIGEAGDAGEAIEAVRAEDWDVMFLDIRLPGRSGVEVLRQVKATNRRSRVPQQGRGRGGNLPGGQAGGGRSEVHQRRGRRTAGGAVRQSNGCGYAAARVAVRSRIPVDQQPIDVA